MGKYFKYNFSPVEELDFLSEELQKLYSKTVKVVSKRMRTLERALKITGMKAPVFAATAKKLFDMVPTAFDTWSANALAEHVQMMYSDETPVYERLEFPNAVTIVDSAFVHTKEWEALRHIGIGGSDSAVIMGVSEWTDPLQLFYEKTGKPKLIEDTDAKTRKAIFDRGHILEDRVIDSFCKLTGAKRTHETRMFRSKKYPHVTANPDEVVIFPDGRIYVFEAKTTAKQNAHKWNNDGIPAYYVTQTRQYPGVLDDDRIVGTYIGCHFIEDYTIGGDYVGSDYNEKQFVAREVVRDKVKETEIMEAEEKFWSTYIVPKVAPPTRVDAEKKREIDRMYVTGNPDPTLPVVELSYENDIKDAIDAYVKAREARLAKEKEAKELQQEEIRLQEPLIAALQGAEKAKVRIDASTFYELKYAQKKKRKSVNYETLEIAYPDAYAACVTTGELGDPSFSLSKPKKYK